MNLRTRHMALLTYTGLAAMVILKGIITEPSQVIGLLAPVVGMFTWDKLKGTPSK